MPSIDLGRAGGGKGQSVRCETPSGFRLSRPRQASGYPEAVTRDHQTESTRRLTRQASGCPVPVLLPRSRSRPRKRMENSIVLGI